MNTSASLRTRLRALDPELTTLQNRLIGALNHRVMGDMHVLARLAVERDRRAAATWIRFRSRVASVAVAPLLVDGQLAHLTLAGAVPDAAAAAAALERIEPVVAGLERTLGDELYPEAVDSEPPADAILLRLDVGRAGGPIAHRLIVAMAGDIEPVGPSLQAAPPMLVRSLRARWTARIDGPALSPARAATIGVGDMMLLGVRPLLAQTSLPGHKRLIAAAIDVSRGLMTLQDDAEISGNAAAIDDSTAVDWDAVRVATIIEIEGGMLSVADAAKLGGGSVLPLPGASGTLAVRVRAGETVIGTGELVALGDGFGVLFTSVAAQAETD